MGFGDIIKSAIGPALGAAGAAASGPDPELTEARVNQINAQIEQAEKQLLLERDRLAFEQQKAGFNSEIQKRQLEIELALAAIEQARKGTPSRDQEIQVRQAGMQQASQDTGQTIDALDRVVARFGGAVK